MKNLTIFVVTSLLIIMGILLIMTSFRARDEFENKVDINIQNLKEIENVVLIIACSLRADHLGCYGYDRETSPNIDQLANEGVLFKHCFAQAPFTVHSVPAIMTSKYPRNLFGTKFETILPNQVDTFAEFFKREGFYTLGFMASPWTRKATHYHQGFDFYFDTSYVLERYSTKKERLAHRIWGRNLNRKIIEKLKTIKDKFFLQILYKDVHVPYTSFPPFRGQFASDKKRDPQKNRYDEAILNFDSHIGTLIDALKELNLLNNTLIIITADHGDGFGKFHQYDVKHGNYLYNTVIKTPLIFYNPNLPIKGLKVSGYVTSMDILPTTLDLMNIKYDRDSFDGVSQKAVFSELLPSDNSERCIVSETNFLKKIPGMRRSSIITNQRWKLIRNYQQTHAKNKKIPAYELYDLKTDHNETNNLFDKSKEFSEKLIVSMENWQKKNSPPWSKNEIILEGNPIENFPPEVKNQLKELGYLK